MFNVPCDKDEQVILLYYVNRKDSNNLRMSHVTHCKLLVTQTDHNILLDMFLTSLVLVSRYICNIENQHNILFVL